jgi:hypothetical protein
MLTFLAFSHIPITIPGFLGFSGWTGLGYLCDAEMVLISGTYQHPNPENPENPKNPDKSL